MYFPGNGISEFCGDRSCLKAISLSKKMHARHFRKRLGTRCPSPSLGYVTAPTFCRQKAVGQTSSFSQGSGFKISVSPLFDYETIRDGGALRSFLFRFGGHSCSALAESVLFQAGSVDCGLVEKDKQHIPIPCLLLV